MKDNGKCALKMIRVITALYLSIVVVTLSNMTVLSFREAHKTNDDIQEEIQIAESDTFERDLKSTSRSETQRSTLNAAKAVVHYKTIDEVTISRDMDLTESCGLSREDFIALISDVRYDTSGFFEENAGTIYDLCQEYELNEIFFCGLIAGESGWNIASNHRNTHNYISMMSGGSLIRYSSDEEGLEAAAKLLHNRYLSEGGSYYRGKTLASIQKIFCPNSSTWVNLIYTCMSHIV